MTGITGENREVAWKFVRAMATPMSVANRDGLGYAAVSSEGELFGERWLNNDEAFRVRNEMTQADIEWCRAYGGVIEPVHGAKYSKFGSIAEDKVSAICLHTRMATSGRGLENTHPFVIGNTALIHNGVINNASKIGLKQSTCDSEAILNLYTKHKVSEDIRNFNKVADKLEGWYACGVITKTPEGVSVVDVLKDKKTRLSGVLIEKIGMIFTTDPSDAHSVAKDLGLDVISTYNFKPGHLVRIEALTGAPVEVTEFDCVDYSHYQSGSSRWYANSNKSSSSKEVINELESDGWRRNPETGAYYKVDNIKRVK